MVLSTGVRRWALILAGTPLHPQWFSFRSKRILYERSAKHACGDVLDIGCAEAALRQRVSAETRYVGLDYPQTARIGYDSRPDVFGDASKLPFRSATFDCVLLLDVLEHLCEPRVALSEINRVVRPTGKLYLSVPCMYPLHDEPFDFQRLTAHGARHWIESAGLRLDCLEARGAPGETAALLTNIALARALLRLARPAPAFIAPLLTPCAVLFLLVNLGGWLLGLLGRKDSLMPHSYWIVASPDRQCEAL